MVLPHFRAITTPRSVPLPSHWLSSLPWPHIAAKNKTCLFYLTTSNYTFALQYAIINLLTSSRARHLWRATSIHDCCVMLVPRFSTSMPFNSRIRRVLLLLIHRYCLRTPAPSETLLPCCVEISMLSFFRQISSCIAALLKRRSLPKQHPNAGLVEIIST